MSSPVVQIVPLSTGRVNGLNLSVPEDAKEVIKSWDQRESTEKYIDSGVDDQVSPVHVSSLRIVILTFAYYLAPPQRSAHFKHTIYTKCANTIHITQSR